MQNKENDIEILKKINHETSLEVFSPICVSIMLTISHAIKAAQILAKWIAMLGSSEAEQKKQFTPIELNITITSSNISA